jgi:hypothetical protein
MAVDEFAPSSAGFVTTLIGGGQAQVATTVTAALWDWRTKRPRIFARLIFHFLLLLALVVLPLLAEILLDMTYSHYQLAQDETPDPFGPEGLVWGLLLLSGLTLFFAYGLVNLGVRFERWLRNDPARVTAIAKDNR